MSETRYKNASHQKANPKTQAPYYPTYEKSTIRPIKSSIYLCSNGANATSDIK